MKYGANQGKIHMCVCGEKQKKGGTRNPQDCMEIIMAAPVCLMFWQCICKDGDGTITDVDLFQLNLIKIEAYPKPNNV